MTNLAALTGEDTITLIRDCPVQSERLWAYLTEPKLLAEWFSGGELSGHQGGSVNFDMGAHGLITEFRPPHLLEYTWNEEKSSHGPIVDSLVRWDLADNGECTRLTLTHSRLPERERLAHSAGWHTFLDRLVASVQGREPVSIEERYAELKREYAWHYALNGHPGDPLS